MYWGLEAPPAAAAPPREHKPAAPRGGEGWRGGGGRPSGANRQAVRLVLVQSPEMVAKVQPLVKWAGYLPPEQGTPKADELPTFYAAVVQDTAIPGDLATDTGIALANMTLAAWDKGRGQLHHGRDQQARPDRAAWHRGAAEAGLYGGFGYPTHKAHIVPLTEQTGVKVLSGRKPRLLRS